MKKRSTSYERDSSHDSGNIRRMNNGRVNLPKLRFCIGKKNEGLRPEIQKTYEANEYHGKLNYLDGNLPSSRNLISRINLNS